MPGLSEAQKIKLEALEKRALDKSLNRKQRRQLARLQNAQRKEKQEEKKKPGKYIKLLTGIGIGVVMLYGIYSYLKSQPVLPPTDMAGHVEASPSSHIVATPMKITVHKHMLEHADGSGPPGVIINYNCKDFQCEGDFLPRLEKIVQKDQYKDFFYLAPYPGMSERLVITKLGEQKVLDVIDEEEIARFITQ